jgi:hypothetical protein
VRAIGSVLTFAATVVAAVVIGFGVPLAWIWIGSQLQGDNGATNTSFSVAMAILFGIIFSYVALLYLAGVVMAALDNGGKQAQAASRAPWMKGQSETRSQRQAVDGIERVFVVTTMIVTAAFWFWFAFKAGSPLPNQ